MKLGVIRVPSGVAAADPAYVDELGRRVEDAGCESLWMVEHVIVPASYESVYPFHPSGKMLLHEHDDLPDPISWLSYLAAKTSTLRLGVGVLILPLRNPVVLAKQLATLDRLSGGRVVAGVGLGWMSEEYDAVGVPFDRRGARADEYLDAMHALWRDDPASFHGGYADFDAIHCNPKPAAGRVPIVIGGVSRAAVRRAARRGDGMHLLRSAPDVVRRVSEQIVEECALIGRDPADVEITMIAPPTAEELDQLAGLGVSRVVLSLWDGDLAQMSERIERYQTQVMGGMARV